MKKQVERFDLEVRVPIKTLNNIKSFIATSNLSNDEKRYYTNELLYSNTMNILRGKI